MFGKEGCTAFRFRVSPLCGQRHCPHLWIDLEGWLVEQAVGAAMGAHCSAVLLWWYPKVILHTWFQLQFPGWKKSALFVIKVLTCTTDNPKQKAVNYLTFFKNPIMFNLNIQLLGGVSHVFNHWDLTTAGKLAGCNTGNLSWYVTLLILLQGWDLR